MTLSLQYLRRKQRKSKISNININHIPLHEIITDFLPEEKENQFFMTQYAQYEYNAYVINNIIYIRSI